MVYRKYSAFRQTRAKTTKTWEMARKRKCGRGVVSKLD